MQALLRLWPSIRAVIWDMDGTLVLSQASNYAAYQQALLEFGVRITEREFCEHYVCGGRTTAELLLARGLDVDGEVVLRRKHEIHLPAIERGSRLAPGARRALGAFRAAGRRQALASANRRVVVRAHLERCRVRHFYEVVVCGEDVPRPKPHPECFLRAAVDLALPPEACLVLEDSPVGVLAACRAGMPVVAVPNRFTRAGDFTGALLLLPSLSALEPARLVSPEVTAGAAAGG